MCAVCLHTRLCSWVLRRRSGSQSDCRGSLLFFVWQWRQLSLLCYDVIGCWLWNTWGNENLIAAELSAAHFFCISSAARSSVVLSSFISSTYDRPSRHKSLSWIKHVVHNHPQCADEPVYVYWQLMFLLLFLFWQRTASLSQLAVEDLKDPLPPQWKCYMSPQGRRYYVNTTNNGKGQCNVQSGHILITIGIQALGTAMSIYIRDRSTWEFGDRCRYRY